MATVGVCSLFQSLNIPQAQICPLFTVVVLFRMNWESVKRGLVHPYMPLPGIGMDPDAYSCGSQCHSYIQGPPHSPIPMLKRLAQPEVRTKVHPEIICC